MADNAAPLILLTRPVAQSTRFAAELQGLAETLVIPLQEIVPTGPVPPLDDIKGVIFTSENAVRVFGALQKGGGLPAWCVGERTARAAEAANFQAMTSGGSADALVAQIIAAAPETPLLHLHGHHTRGLIAKRLCDAGIETEAAEIYDQQAIEPEQPITGLAQERFVFAPLFSPRSATLLAAHIGGDTANWHFPCLSDAVRDALPDHLRPSASVAENSSASAMVCLMKRHISP